MATYDLTQTTPTKLKTGDIINVPYSGTYKTIVLPKGKYKLEVWGAQGGSYSSTYYGGKGGYSYGTLTLEDDKTTLYCYAGQQKSGYGSSAGATSGTAFNGGGYGTTVYYSSTYTYACSGGGGSDIRIGSTSLYARVIVAGGGSGSTNGSTGWYGGGITSGGYSSTYQATQTTAGKNGSFGVGANYVPSSTNYKYSGAGGGGGWYGGGADTSRSDSATATRQYCGGGSGYVYTSSTASNYPSGCLLTSAYYLTDAATVAGNTSFTDYSGSTVTGHSGNGCVRITVVKIGTPLRVKKAVDYTELSYIESTGTQFIDTKFKPNQDTRVILDIDISAQSSYPTALLGGRNGDTTSNASFVMFIMTASQFRSDYCSATVNADISTSGRFLIDKNKEVCTINDIAYTNTATTFQSNYTLAILTENDPSGYDTRATKGKIYSCKVYDNDVLIRDYVPALDSNNVVCLFDKVNAEFVYNVGSGTFVAGEIVKEVTVGKWVDTQKTYVKTADNTWAEGKSVYVKTNEDLAILDYIESTGTQWIDTKYIPNSNTRIVMDFKSTQVPSGWYGFYSSRAGSSGSYGSQFALWMNSTGEFRSNYSTDTGIYLASTISPTDRHVIDHNKTVVAMDGTVVAAHASATFTGACNLFLFAGHTGGVMELPANMILYSCQIYDNDVLIRDYIPVIDSSGVACLYDKVTNQLFYNAGTGNFIAGYKTEFEPETELVFLESTGTQYVDTGVTATQNTGYEIDFSTDSPLTTDSSWGAVMGAITSGTNRFGFDTYTSHAGGALYYGKPIYDPNIVVGKRMTISLMDGVLTTQSATTTLSTSTFDTGASIALFARKWNTGTIDGYSKTKIYACKIYDNGILVRDYIPKTDINGTPALFDKVSGTYYYNQGTGTFNTGTILKRPYWKQVA